jgi:hypothetical protein
LYIASKQQQHPNNNNKGAAAEVPLACYRAIANTCLAHGNVQRYKQVFGPGGLLGGSIIFAASQQQQQQDSSTGSNNLLTYNANWVAEQESLYRQGRDVLQHRLQAAQSQLHKVSKQSFIVVVGFYCCFFSSLFQLFSCVSQQH